RSRLEIQHNLVRYVTRRNHFAQLSSPKRILDVHTGTGIWMREVADEFPDCCFIGLDSRPGLYKSSTMPSNCHWLPGDIAEGSTRDLEKEGPFDMIIHRFQAFFLPATSWDHVLNQLRHLITPEGHLELHETDLAIVHPGPMGKRVNEWLVHMCHNRSIIPSFPQDLEGPLVNAGFHQIRRREISFAVGEWAGVPGDMMLRNIRGILTGFLRDNLVIPGLVPANHFDSTVQLWEEECERLHSCVRVYFYTARPNPLHPIPQKEARTRP
ncbi:MAG: S-adenosyl-L-methionine-dependent methyltransferase, partial [Piptocephalis tieghemiana]